MSLIGNELYRFDDFELQPARRALVRNGEKIQITPRTFEVLLCLVQNAGRVVLKEELLKTVWPESFVEESNLTQHIFWLRKALDDKAEYIVTIPGRGYEFNAPVQAISEATVSNSGPGVSFRIQQATEVTRIVVEERQRPVASALPGRNRKQLVLIACVIWVIVLASGIYGVWRWRHRVIPGDHHEVVLADFENSTGNPDFDRALKTLLAIDLNQSPDLAVATESDTRTVLKLMNRSPDENLTPEIAREVCERLNDQVVLSGTIARFDKKYLVTLTATDCSNGKYLLQTKAVAPDRDSVMKAVDSVATDMLKRLGDPLRSMQKPGQPLLLAHTSSLDALRAYSQARALHIRLKFADAVPLYKHAIDLDPNFADAHAQLANCYNNLGEALQGRDEMARAYELREQASEPDRLRITAMYEYWKTGDRHEAIRTYQAWAQMYPLQTNPWALLGEFQASVGRFDLAIEALQHAVALNPRSSDAARALAMAQRFAGRLDDARATCRAAFARGIENNDLHRTLLEVAFLQNDTATFQEQLRWFHENAFEADSENVDADIEVSQGKMRSAVTRYLHVAELQQKDGLEEAALEGFAGVPQTEAEVGLLPEARQHFKRYEPNTPLTEPSLAAVIIAAAEIGELDVAQKKLRFMLDKGKQDSDVQELFAPEGRAIIDLAQGKPELAIQDMKPTQPWEFSEPNVPAILGQAYLAAHQPKLAEQEFRNITEHTYINAISDGVPLAHLGLARALKMQGDAAAARHEYETFFSEWKNADPDLPVLKQARKEYAELH